MKSRNLLTIAGSDSSGGAGIQADLKTFTSLQSYGLSVVTAVTSQNTLGVNGVQSMSPSMVSSQLETVASDIPIDGIKTGMLYSSEIIEAIDCTFSKLYPDPELQPPLVIDPVMVSSSGHDLLEPGAPEVLIGKLLSRSTLVTPNVPEALILSGWRAKGRTISSIHDMEDCCRDIARLGARNVLLKGGHFLMSNNTVDDVLYEAKADTFHTFKHPRLHTNNTHGTGCTLSAALTVYLAGGVSVIDAVNAAIVYVEGAMLASPKIGSGSGPLNHFHNILQRPFPPRSVHQQYPFTSALIDSTGDSWEIFTLRHKFLVGVRDGTLPKKCFQHFLRQDYIFLTHYARIHSLMAYKCATMEEIDATATIVKHIAAESRKHINMCKAWGLSEADFLRTSESNQTIAYTRYVMDIGFSKSLLHLRVATAPCLIGYGEMAIKLKNDVSTAREGNPYWEWILNYSNEDFQNAVNTGRDLLEQMVSKDIPSDQTFHELKAIFKKAVDLEIDFWQMGLDCS